VQKLVSGNLRSHVEVIWVVSWIQNWKELVSNCYVSVMGCNRLTKFSTMKVGPPKHVKPKAKPKHLSSEVKVTACRMTMTLAGLETKKRVEKLCDC